MSNIQIPLFPLNGAIIFPKSNLPLNIFEERYIEMINFSISSNRLIGMIQTDKNDKLYSIGCVGKINSFSELEDGRFIINLLGQDYFSIKKSDKQSKKFILADVEILSKKYNIDQNNIKKFDKKILIQKYKRYVDNQNIEVDINLIEKVDDEELIKFIAMSCSFSTEHKQMLLETYNLYEIGHKLISLFDFYPLVKNSKNSIN